MTFLESGEVLVHIGSPKTGTTALQAAFAENKRALRSAGIRYPGRQRSHWRASCALLGDPITMHPADPPADPVHWERLRQRVRNRPDRALVSSEGFVDLSPDQISRAVDDLGGDEVKVLLTVRPLGQVLPSLWQQSLKAGAPKPLPGPSRRVKSRLVRPYEKWLQRTLAGKDNGDRFWTRFDYADIVHRWSHVVGANRMAVVVVDPSDPSQLMAQVAGLLGLSPGVLENATSGTNRSLSRQEALFVRSWLRSVELEDLLPADLYHDWVRRGALAGLVAGRKPGPAEGKIGMPQWARDSVLRHATESATAIQASGVQVVGDLADLRSISAESAAEPEVDRNAPIPAEVAFQLLNGALEAAMATIRQASDTGRDEGS